MSELWTFERLQKLEGTQGPWHGNDEIDAAITAVGIKPTALGRFSVHTAREATEAFLAREEPLPEIFLPSATFIRGFLLGVAYAEVRSKP